MPYCTSTSFTGSKHYCQFWNYCVYYTPLFASIYKKCSDRGVPSSGLLLHRGIHLLSVTRISLNGIKWNFNSIFITYSHCAPLIFDYDPCQYEGYQMGKWEVKKKKKSFSSYWLLVVMEISSEQMFDYNVVRISDFW